MQCHPAHQLHVEVALADRAPRRLAHDRERLDEQVVEVLSGVEPLAELDGHVRELLVAHRRDLVLERVDERHDLGEAADLPALTGAQTPSRTRSCHGSLRPGPARSRLGDNRARRRYQRKSAAIRSPEVRPGSAVRRRSRRATADASATTPARRQGGAVPPRRCGPCRRRPAPCRAAPGRSGRVFPGGSSRRGRRASFFEGPSTTTSSTRPMRARLRCSAERSTTSFRRAKRSAITPGGTKSSIISAARVPDRGEKMKVKALS